VAGRHLHLGAVAINERELRRRRGDLEALTDLAESLERAVDSSNIARSLLDSVIEPSASPRRRARRTRRASCRCSRRSAWTRRTARRPGRPGAARVADEAHRTHSTLLVRSLDAESDPWLASLLPDAENLGRGPAVGRGPPARRARARAVRPVRRPHPAPRRVRPRALRLRTPRWPCATPGCSSRSSGLAATDGLTKIANRRTFEATLEREVARATRSAEHVSLVMVDIDHFKSLNDTHGHQAGDEVLRNVAAALAIECRDFDTPARYGGEEFASSCPGCGPSRGPEDRRAAAPRGPRRALHQCRSPPAPEWRPSPATPATPTPGPRSDDALYEEQAGRPPSRTTASQGVPPEAQVDALLRRAVYTAARAGAERRRHAQRPAPRAATS
jgi:GGDEF domain-containing protein